MTTPTTPSERGPWLPPRWFIRLAWAIHRAIVRVTGGRRGLGEPTPGGRFGTLRLSTTGRKTGQTRVAILGYYEDGPDLVTLAMNGWSPGEPGWWLNLQAQPDVVVDLKDGPRAVHARAAEGDERDRLWLHLRDVSGYGSDLDGYARRRPEGTAVVVFEPHGTTSPAASDPATA